MEWHGPLNHGECTEGMNGTVLRIVATFGVLMLLTHDPISQSLSI
jgi:hypothetical protein